MILNILGGGGSGKTTLRQDLLCKSSVFTSFVSYTTRHKRDGELDGVHYHFLSTDQFLSNNHFVFRRYANGHFYGVLSSDLDIGHNDRAILVTTFDACGIAQLEMRGFDVKIVFLNIPEDERIRRMLIRGDSTDIVEQRILLDRSQLMDFNFVSPILEICRGSVSEISSQVIQYCGLALSVGGAI